MCCYPWSRGKMFGSKAMVRVQNGLRSMGFQDLTAREGLQTGDRKIENSQAPKKSSSL